MGDWQAIGHDPCSLGGNDTLEGNYTAVDNVTYDLIGTLDINTCYVFIPNLVNSGSELKYTRLF